MSWLKGASKPEEKDFANASDYLETWNDSDIITAVNAQKRFKTCYRNGGIATQKHNIKVLRSIINIQR